MKEQTTYSRRSFILGTAGVVTMSALMPGSVTHTNVHPIKALGHIDEREGINVEMNYSYIRRTYMINGQEWHYLMRENGISGVSDKLKAKIDAAAYKLMVAA